MQKIGIILDLSNVDAALAKIFPVLVYHLPELRHHHTAYVR
jgi:hypothetical protein